MQKVPFRCLQLIAAAYPLYPRKRIEFPVCANADIVNHDLLFACAGCQQLALLSIRLRSRQQLSHPQPYNLPSSLLRTQDILKGLGHEGDAQERSRRQRRNCMQSGSSGLAHVTRSIDFLVLLQCGSRRRRILFVHDHRPLQ